jgi:hypothetical protein
MVSSWPSPSVLTLGCPCHALSRVCFISPCPPLAPLPPPCIGTCLTHPWCHRARHSGRSLSLPLMARLPSSSRVACAHRLQHLHVLLLQSHGVVGTLPVGDLFGTIHPSFSSRCNCKGVQWQWHPICMSRYDGPYQVVCTSTTKLLTVGLPTYLHSFCSLVVTVWWHCHGHVKDGPVFRCQFSPGSPCSQTSHKPFSPNDICWFISNHVLILPFSLAISLDSYM